MLAIIGGSGLTMLGNLEVTKRLVMRTPYGDPSGALTFGKIRGHEVVFLARHGYAHTIPPHDVNYRANIWALGSQNVDRVLSIASVGGIRKDLVPGALAVPDQIIDYTHGRKSTFFDNREKPVTHTDFTEPYCASLRKKCLEAARLAGHPAIDGGVYAATQGPRLETAAEVNRMERDGADMIGMTGMPEAILAREAGLCYAALAVVANHAAGRGDSEHAVHLEDVNAVLQVAMEKVGGIIEILAEIDGD
ncbi:MAG: S-methyl-5'-thioinosine phosphorylase [Burkholderiales bacterium]|nr:S-methyl-5'-thioinosine phosphorylase [Burkholderiales bacterium]